MFFMVICFLAAVNAQHSLPIFSDSAYHLLPAETLIKTQLSSWGITIGPLSLSVDGGIDLGLHLRNTRSCRTDTGGSCDPQIVAIQAYLDALVAAGWDGASDIDFDLPQFAGISLEMDLFDPPRLPRRRGRRGLRLPFIGEVSIDLSASLGIGSGKGWGREAENVARGERGDTEWFTYITIGSPPQSLPILPDTGSSDMFVYGKECRTCYTSNHSSFDPLSSSTYRNSSNVFRLGYADESGASGYIGQDTVTFGNANTVSTKMIFGLATEAHGRTFRDSGRSGILGLGQDAMTTLPGGSTLLSQIVKSGQIIEKVMSIRLNKGDNQRGVMLQEGGGSYLFGGVEEQYLRGGRAGLSWVKTTSDNYWGFGLEDISIGLASAMIGDTKTPRRAIIDSGTSLIITSDQAAKSIHSFIPHSFVAKSGVWYIPCDVSSLTSANLFVTISGRRFGVPIEDLAWKASGTFPDMCISGVQGGMPYFTVLGDLFIKNHYVVLSYEKGNGPQVGLGDRTDVPLII